MKPGELQRNNSLLSFLRRHVTLKEHKQEEELYLSVRVGI